MKPSKGKTAKTIKVGQSFIKSWRKIRAWQRGKAGLHVIEVPNPIPPSQTQVEVFVLR
jgi:hypothetical protein